MDIKFCSIDSIKPYLSNPRKNDENIQKVADSIKKYGWNQPIVVDSDGVIVVGHTRYKAALLLQLKEVPVLYAKNLTEQQSKAYRIMDNKAHDFTKWNFQELKFELDDLPDVEVTGFTLKQLDDILYPELGLIGKKIDGHIKKHKVIVNCKDRKEMLMVQKKLIDKGYLKCQTSYW